MANPSRIARLSRGLMGRLIIGVVAIHLVLIPLLFAGVLYIVKEGYQTQFIDQLRSDSYLLSILVGNYAAHSAHPARRASGWHASG